MPLQLSPAGPEDLPRMAEVERLAYASSPLNSVLFPGPFPAGPGNSRAIELENLMREDQTTRWFKIVDDELTGEEAKIAFAKWHVYETKSEPKPMKEFGPGCNVEACEMLFGGLGDLRERLMGDKPFVYLHLLQTDPKHQRRGAAGMLLKWGLDEANRLRLPAYLESSASGYPLYEKNGFKVIEEFTVDFSKWGATKPHTNWAMLKEPSS